MGYQGIARLLRRLAEVIEGSSPADVEALLAGRARLTVAPRSGSSAREGRADGGSKKRRERSQKDLARVGARLRELDSREAGLKALANVQLTKNELEELARLMDLPVYREDDAERLKRRIVESSIGSRLNSQAIRGE